MNNAIAMYIVEVGTTDGNVYKVEIEGEIGAKRLRDIFIRSGFSNHDISYTPAHTIYAKAYPKPKREKKSA